MLPSWELPRRPKLLHRGSWFSQYEAWLPPFQHWPTDPPLNRLLLRLAEGLDLEASAEFWYLSVFFFGVLFWNRKGTEGGPVHSGEKPVVHTQCNFSCTTACHLKIHNQIHLGEMSFNCRQCNCACTTAVNLKRHMLTHSRAKPFGCSQCNNTFTTVQNL